MFEIIVTALTCYAAAGFYIALTFDHADSSLGRAISLKAQAGVILTWPLFIYMVAHEHEYVVEISDQDGDWQ